MWGAPLYAGGSLESYVCGVWSSGFGASVLAFFGERRPVVVGHGGGPVWLRMGLLGDARLGVWRSVLTELGRLLWAGPSM